MQNISKILFTTLTIIFLTSCSQEINVKSIDGYWEVNKVIRADNSIVEYSSNNICDYYQLTSENKGFFKKVFTKIDGKVWVDDIQQEFEITTQDGNTYLIMTSVADQRKLKIKKLTDKQLTIENEENITYFYNKTEPKNFLKNED
ncbi:MAG: hypothetical protein Q4B43_07355 [Bacteroidota bacterium]|nr:hypothetical protein [Bacteroidota bacterium]